MSTGNTSTFSPLLGFGVPAGRGGGQTDRGERGPWLRVLGEDLLVRQVHDFCFGLAAGSPLPALPWQGLPGLWAPPGLLAEQNLMELKRRW